MGFVRQGYLGVRNLCSIWLAPFERVENVRGELSLLDLEMALLPTRIMHVVAQSLPAVDILTPRSYVRFGGTQFPAQVFPV